jgi:hypothetical protein
MHTRRIAGRTNVATLSACPHKTPGNLSLFALKPHAMAGRPPPARDIYVDYDISHLVREAIAGNPKDLTVVPVPRGLLDARGEPLPVPAEAQGTVGSVRIIGR